MTVAAPDVVALLGGSFDPVHDGHLALARRFSELLQPDCLRVIPAGCPWQKGGLQADAAHRVAMLCLAFGAAGLPMQLDEQEIARGTPSYTIDTLAAVRAELGPQAALVFLMGADQLRRLDTWHRWRELFALAHIGIGARPGFALDDASLPPAVAAEMARRQAPLATLRATPCGATFLAHDLAVDISATDIRAALQRGDTAHSHVAPVVLDYIQQHQLYKS